MEALKELKATEPPVWLAPSDSLSKKAREASGYLFSTLKPHVPKSPFEKLLLDGFDAEQIWQQIDLLSVPLLSRLRREIKHFEKNPNEIAKFPKVSGEEKKEKEEVEREEETEEEEEDVDVDFGEFEEEDEEEEEEEEGKESGGIEDKFLKVKELEDYLEDEEAREYGLDNKKEEKKKVSDKNKKRDEEELEEDEDEEDGEGEAEDDDDSEDDELGLFGGDDDDDAEKLENARYEDFFVAKKKKKPNRKFSLNKEEFSSDDNDDDDDVGENGGGLSTHEKQLKKLRAEVEELEKANLGQKTSNLEDESGGGLSTHERQLEKLQAEIEEMERANLEQKPWTLQGEVTASKRPKNSALEVDLDFEHNMRPVPVITEEVSASLEDIIKSRIIEGRFDDIQRIAKLPPKAPKEVKELDDNKSKKGLAEVYEEEYVHKTNPDAGPLSISDELKKEANFLFLKLCSKLDALSHYHFTPKPVIEDMTIQTNVPALAMEEIAPMAVSDAAMLAPEEIFASKGDIKEETELTQADRKRRRANKKRKFKAEEAKRMVAKKARDNALLSSNADR